VEAAAAMTSAAAMAAAAMTSAVCASLLKSREREYRKTVNRNKGS
jgi:hypothetical protein